MTKMICILTVHKTITLKLLIITADLIYISELIQYDIPTHDFISIVSR